MLNINDLSLKDIKADSRYKSKLYRGILCINNKPAANFEFCEDTKTGIAVFNYNVLKLGNSINYSLENRKHLQKYMDAIQTDSDNEDLFLEIANAFLKEEGIEDGNLNYLYEVLLKKHNNID